MKRPLVPVALCYAAGLLLAAAFQPPLLLLFAVAFALLGAAVSVPQARVWLLGAVLVVAGWTNLVTRTAVISPVDLRQLLGDSAAYVTVRGTLKDTPNLRIFVRDEQESFRTIAQLHVTSLNHSTNWQPAAGHIVVTTIGELPEHFFAGQNVEITGVLARPPPPLARGLFDYRTHLARQGIYYQLRADSTNAWVVAGSALTELPFTDRFLRWAKQTLARGLPVQDEALELRWAMTLGWKTALTNEVSEPFMRSGTMHIFAISGLHIALIAGILVSLLRVMQVSRTWCGLILIPLLWFYTAATGWQSSAIRSTIMMTVIIGGWALRRPSDLLNSLAAAAFVILLWEPQQLFQASFQLSFFVVLSIALFLPPLEKLRDRLLEIDPLLPAELLPRWQRSLRWGLRLLLTSFVTSLAAWLGSLPLTAYYFHLFSPVTLLANVLIVPLSALALMSSLGSLICGAWWPWATELFNHSGWFWMTAMIKVSHTATKLPGAFFYVSPPSLATIGCYYAVLVGVLSGWLVARARRGWAVAGLVCLCVALGWRWQDARTEVQLTVLPLNGGHSVFANLPGGKEDWVLDCGNTNAVEFVMKPFLRAQGVNRLPRLALTHGDLRHVGGAEGFSELFQVGEVITSPARFRSPAYRRIIAALGDSPRNHRTLNRGDELGPWSVLHPAADDTFTQADDAALVLLGNFHRVRVLLLSDLGRSGQEALMNRYEDLRADIVVTGLPAQSEPICNPLLELIQPHVVIVADTEFPATERAKPALRQRIDALGIPVIYTRTNGAVTLKIRPKGWKLESPAGGWLAGQDNYAGP
ncbi:MAG: ComEC/Rec2 family competence protein [Verrucomicrobiae bacterium]|nr:ComEC/Rec2 family competence protein [Verrucomicrobiae bacterium]